jgi:hypothetical protein
MKSSLLILLFSHIEGYDLFTGYLIGIVEIGDACALSG